MRKLAPALAWMRRWVWVRVLRSLALVSGRGRFVGSWYPPTVVHARICRIVGARVGGLGSGSIVRCRSVLGLAWYGACRLRVVARIGLGCGSVLGFSREK